jgi:hypothetical protein
MGVPIDERPYPAIPPGDRIKAFPGYEQMSPSHWRDAW